MKNYFECKVRYEKTLENGMQKKVTEPYLVDALSFTEAEARIIEEIKPYISGEFTIEDIKRARLSELFFNENGDRYFEAKVEFITLDEKSGSEKRTSVKMLAQANDIEDARQVIIKGMEGTMADYNIASLKETKIMDVFPYSSESNTEPVKLDIPKVEKLGTPEWDKVEQNDEDPLFEDAKKLVIDQQEATTSMLQRKFSIGYNRAGRLMDQLERAGVVGKSDYPNFGDRKVLISKT